MRYVGFFLLITLLAGLPDFGFTDAKKANVASFGKRHRIEHCHADGGLATWTSTGAPAVAVGGWVYFKDEQTEKVVWIHGDDVVVTVLD
jgi:hypothetical protein